MNIESEMKRILIEIVEGRITEDNICSNTNIVEDIGLDSLQMINLILMIEDAFDLEIDFDEIEYEIFLRFSELVEFIKEKLEV